MIYFLVVSGTPQVIQLGWPVDPLTQTPKPVARSDLSHNQSGTRTRSRRRSSLVRESASEVLWQQFIQQIIRGAYLVGWVKMTSHISGLHCILLGWFQMLWWNEPVLWCIPQTDFMKTKILHVMHVAGFVDGCKVGGIMPVPLSWSGWSYRVVSINRSGTNPTRPLMSKCCFPEYLKLMLTSCERRGALASPAPDCQPYPQKCVLHLGLAVMETQRTPSWMGLRTGASGRLRSSLYRGRSFVV